MDAIVNRLHGLSAIAFTTVLGTVSGFMIVGTGCPIDHRPVSPDRGRPGFVFSGYPEIQKFWAEDVASLSRWHATEFPLLVEILRAAREKTDG